MKYLYTKTEHYKKFILDNNTNRLSKGIKIMPENSKMNLFKKSLNYINEEIFQKPIITEYEVVQINDNFIKLLFTSNSKTDYRLDIHIINEINGLVNHIAFTKDDSKYDKIPNNPIDFEKYEYDYNKLTGMNEMIEIMNRIHFILIDLLKKSLIKNYFCIGGTEIIEKDNIYEYLLKVIVGDDGFKKMETEVYDKVGWGLYFSINKI
jgi:hypothetical protein